LGVGGNVCAVCLSACLLARSCSRCRAIRLCVALWRCLGLVSKETYISVKRDLLCCSLALAGSRQMRAKQMSRVCRSSRSCCVNIPLQANVSSLQTNVIIKLKIITIIIPNILHRCATSVNSKQTSPTLTEATDQKASRGGRD